MVWTVEEAFKQHMGDKGFYLQKVEEIPDEKITDADRHMMEVVKKTEGMSDAVRIRHLHNAIGFIEPFLTRLPTGPSDEVARLAKLTKTLKAAYKSYCDDNLEKPRSKILNAVKKLDFSKLNSDDWYDILESCCTGVPEADYNADVHEVKKVAEFFYYLELSKTRFAKDIQD